MIKLKPLLKEYKTEEDYKTRLDKEKDKTAKLKLIWGWKSTINFQTFSRLINHITK